MADWSTIGAPERTSRVESDAALPRVGSDDRFGTFLDRARADLKTPPPGAEVFDVLAPARVPLSTAPLGTYLATQVGGEGGANLVRSLPLTTIFAGLPAGAGKGEISDRLQQSSASWLLPPRFELSPDTRAALSKSLESGPSDYGRQTQGGWTLTPLLDIDLGPSVRNLMPLTMGQPWTGGRETAVPDPATSEGSGQAALGLQLVGPGLCLFFNRDADGLAASLASTEAVTSAAKASTGLKLTFSLDRSEPTAPSLTIAAGDSAPVAVPSEIARSLVRFLDPPAQPQAVALGALEAGRDQEWLTRQGPIG